MKMLTNVSLLIIVMVSLSNCSSVQKLQKEAPFKIGQSYYQHWVAGVRGGGSGVNVFIEVNGEVNPDILLDSMHYNKTVSKIEMNPANKNLYIGRFSTPGNSEKDIIMSSDPYKERNNPLPVLKRKSPFELKESECVISYRENGTVKYYKISGLKKKEAIHYPSAPPAGNR